MISASISEDATPTGRNFLSLFNRKKTLRTQKKVETEEICKYFMHETKTEKIVSEVYIRDSTVVHSVNNHVRNVYECGEVVKDAFVTEFFEYPKPPAFIFSKEEGGNDKEDLGKTSDCICILEEDNLRIFYESGEDFIIALNLATPVKKVWPCKFGVIMETERSPSVDQSLLNTPIGTNSLLNQNFPTIWSLLHPLNDFSRIAIKMLKSQIRPLSHQDQLKIIFISKEPSICLAFNQKSGQHCAFYIRQATPNECLDVENKTQNESQINSNFATPGQSPGTSFMSSTNQSPLNSSSVQNTRLTSSIHRNSLSHNSPLSNMAIFSRSPANFLPSPKLSAKTPTTPLKTPQGDTLQRTVQPNEESPDISLVFAHVWNEPSAIARQNGHRMTRKSFLTKDFNNDTYLCYLQTHIDLLALVRVDTGTGKGGRGSNSSPYHLGAVNHISATDAIPIPNVNLLVVLDVGKLTLSLYSGLTKIGRITYNSNPANSVQLASIAQEISALNLDSKPSTPLHPSQVKSGDSVMTSSRPASAIDAAFNDSLSLLSPVAQIDNEKKIYSLNHSYFNEFVIKYVNPPGDLKVTLPDLATCPLILATVKAVCSDLSKENSLLFYKSWYACRNAPGPPCISPAKEWKLFINCLLSLIGYQIGDHFLLFPSNADGPNSSPSVKRKIQKCDGGSDGDWDFLLSSFHHQESGSQLSELLGLESVCRVSDSKGKKFEQREILIDCAAPLFSSLAQIFISLHLLYEEFKLDKCMMENLQYLSGLLARIAGDLNLPNYVRHYWIDFPLNCPKNMEEAKTGQVKPNIISKLKVAKHVPSEPPDVFSDLIGLLSGSRSPNKYMANPNLGLKTRNLCFCYLILADFRDFEKLPLVKNDETLRFLCSKAQDTGLKSSDFLVNFLAFLKYDLQMLSTFPAVLILPFLKAFHQCKFEPSSKFLKFENNLIGRQDLAEHCDSKRKSIKKHKEIPGRYNGMEHIDTNDIVKMRWPVDKRVSEVKKMLDSVTPVPINIAQRPEVSDHDFVEEQERTLLSFCVRTLALPVGRGALTLFTACPLVTDTMPIPKLCLSGRAPPRGVTVDMEHIDVTPNMEKWSLFHNGVAAGLRMSQQESDINSNWIVFNKPKDNPNSVSSLTEHAGFLMALGLAGHLNKLRKLDSFEYLMKGNDMITIGVLLGIAASQRGSMDIIATKKISTQLIALLPRSATELPLSQVSQIAALVSLGLLYEGSGQRHMAEVCLGELGRPPTSEVENCTDRESYSLAAGLALGMITFGQGSSLTKGSLSDLQLPDQLYYHMIGGPKSSLGEKSSMHSQSIPQSFQVREGDTINIDVTGPGATMALGMMFFDSDNVAIADWMLTPNTQFMLEFVRPEFLMLRTIARGLILWKDIKPTKSWLGSNFPENMKRYCLVKPSNNHPRDIDLETINQAFCNVVSGAAFILGIRFAGSNNMQAYDVLMQSTQKFVAISKRSVSQLPGMATIEQAICVHVLALSIVMAGSGDLKILRLIRFLRSRVGQNHITVTYGSHLALHLALGVLFLGGGTLTLSTSPKAISAMICAFYPKFPTHSNDNRYHLQALRHLYVLATEPRLILPRDVISNKLVYCHFEIDLKDTVRTKEKKITIKAPGMLPELKYISKVTLSDERYHSFIFNEDNFEDLKRILFQNGGFVSILQKAGCLPYDQDPKGHRSIVGSSLSCDNVMQWRNSTSYDIGEFSSDPQVKYFSGVLWQSKMNHLEFKKMFNDILYECAAREKMELISFWIETLHWISVPDKRLAGFQNRQIASLIWMARNDSLGYLSGEVCGSLIQQILKIIKSWSISEHQLTSQASLLALLPDMTNSNSSRVVEVLEKKSSNPLKALKSEVDCDVLYVSYSQS